MSFKSPPTIIDAASVPTPSGDWMHLEAVCREYPLSRAKLFRLSAEGRLPIFKLGRRSVLRRSDVEHLLEDLPRLHPRHAAEPAA